VVRLVVVDHRLALNWVGFTRNSYSLSLHLRNHFSFSRYLELLRHLPVTDFSYDKSFHSGLRGLFWLEYYARSGFAISNASRDANGSTLYQYASVCPDEKSH
jgi:hypothetical protein